MDIQSKKEMDLGLIKELWRCISMQRDVFHMRRDISIQKRHRERALQVVTAAVTRCTNASLPGDV